MGPTGYGANAVREGDPGRQPIRLFIQGLMRRNFAYIDDIVEGVIHCLYKPAIADPGFDAALPNPDTSCPPPLLV